MAFKTATQTPAEVYPIIKRNGNQLLLNAQGIRSLVAADGADYGSLQEGYKILLRSKNQLVALKSTAGLDAYAAAQEGDPAYQLVSEIDTAVAAIDAIFAWGIANVPATVGLKSLTAWDGAGSMIAEPISAAGKTALLGLIDSLIASMS